MNKFEMVNSFDIKKEQILSFNFDIRALSSLGDSYLLHCRPGVGFVDSIEVRSIITGHPILLKNLAEKSERIPFLLFFYKQMKHFTSRTIQI
jgi:hypothetical protein